MDTDPDMPELPLHEPAIQLLALAGRIYTAQSLAPLELQLRVVVPPAGTLVGFAEMLHASPGSVVGGSQLPQSNWQLEQFSPSPDSHTALPHT